MEKTIDYEGKYEEWKNGTIAKDMFKLVEASKLSLNDEFMQYEPIEKYAKEIKDCLSQLIKEGLKDFYAPICAPTKVDHAYRIDYIFGKKPAVNIEYEDWERIAENFNIKRGSKLGSKEEWIAFCGYLIKLLVMKGARVEDAWHDVCINSKNIGHYRDSEDSILDFEPTGSRGVCGFYDLGNAYKYLESVDVPSMLGDEMFSIPWLAGGFFRNEGSEFPLARLEFGPGPSCTKYSYGWIIYERDLPEEGSIEKEKLTLKDIFNNLNEKLVRKKLWSQFLTENPKLKELAVKAGVENNVERAIELRNSIAINCGDGVCNSDEEREFAKYLYCHDFDTTRYSKLLIGRVIMASEAGEKEL